MFANLYTCQPKARMAAINFLRSDARGYPFLGVRESLISVHNCVVKTNFAGRGLSNSYRPTRYKIDLEVRFPFGTDSRLENSIYAFALYFLSAPDSAVSAVWYGELNSFDKRPLLLRP